MRSFLILLALTWICQHPMAQSPDRLSYQAIVRNASGNVVANQSVGMRITILKGSATGASVYVETQTRNTNASGLITLEIGGGIPVTGSFALVNWGQGPYFIKTETDVTGGTNYQLTGTTQLLSVPYSLYAQSADLKYSAMGDTLYSGKEYVIVPGLSAANLTATGQGTATLTTSLPVNITDAGATLGGQISNQGGASVTTRGICYSITGSPTISNSTVIAGSGTGSYQVNLTGLNSGTQYYARAFATNSFGTSYGNQVVFTTTGSSVSNCTGKVKDIDGNEYNVVQIGNQCWMKENLRVTRFRDSSLIPLDTSGGFNGDGDYTNGGYASWSLLETAARCMYNNNQANVPVYGYLYNKYSAISSKGLCPTGWHVPSNDEYVVLANTLGGELVAGGKMKSTGTTLWKNPNLGADNSSGFNALPAGGRIGREARFFGKGEYAFLQTSISGWVISARELWYDSNILKTHMQYQSDRYNQHGTSVRCLRD
jgi:uncharacterized protein (TIGR02145 family)